MAPGRRQALVVRGGWEGHRPRETTNLFLPFLSSHGFHVLVEETLEAYEDEKLLAGTDLIVQCWTGGDITAAESAGLAAAVRAGTGLAGWHGGIVDAFREDPAYPLLVGGQRVPEVAAPRSQLVAPTTGHAEHPVAAGLGPFEVNSPPYWVHGDPLNDVLATVTFPPDETRERPAVIPAVWTRRFGRGRVFVSTVGHGPEDLRVPEARALVERGLLWASR
ncbi:ThuA domain-containing protein [Streptomyces triticirhizae]|uniref:ThuA domain-containing protein n=1 Tax=Streptomyces triticirhizae TaxID=2483353 RepID=A0A3M2M913_9ACTN|nr:ThuA domain-containing protein [Streptomyces triticirhizae]RMI45550.1 ThuA domain-containing protein [Streptomyces triticirhizae]